MPDIPPRCLPAIAGRARTEAGLALDLDLAPAAGWFAGHFPGCPILPGVVQIDWALELAGRELGLGPLAAAGMQVKFKALIRPGDRLTLILDHRPEQGRLGFEYRRDGAVCASGRIALAP